MHLSARVFWTCAFGAMILGLTTVADASVQISSKATRNVTCSDGVCAPTAKNAVLNVNDLAGLLASADIKVVSDSSAQDIELTAPLGWTSSHRLTLDAWRSITFAKPLNVGDNGALSLVTNDGGSTGDFSFTGKGHITFASEADSLIINGESYVLATSISGLAADIQANLSGFYALAESYDAAGDGTYTVAPLSSFSGTFEGLGNTISNFSLRLAAGNTAGGLFQCSCPSSTVRDIAMVRASVQGSQDADSIGALAGLNYGTIKGASASGSVRGDAKNGANDEAGGLVGLNHGSIIDSHARVNVSGAATAGGLVGFMESVGATAATISNSSTSGSVSGQTVAGGLVGHNEATIETSYATGSVRTTGDSKGSGTELGGLVGETETSAGQVDNSYSTGAVSVGKFAIVGGMMGLSFGTIDASYSTGVVNAGSNSDIGGFVGYDATHGGITDAYWDMDTSGITDPSQGAGNRIDDSGITGLTTEQLQSGLPGGFSPTVWAENPHINGGLPYLLANPPS